MALVRCPECRMPVSSEATECPHCHLPDAGARGVIQQTKETVDQALMHLRRQDRMSKATENAFLTNGKWPKVETHWCRRRPRAIRLIEINHTWWKGSYVAVQCAYCQKRFEFNLGSIGLGMETVDLDVLAWLGGIEDAPEPEWLTVDS